MTAEEKIAAASRFDRGRIAVVGDLMLDVCLVIDEELKGDMVYTMFSVIINYLDANYRKMMKCVWQGD